MITKEEFHKILKEDKFFKDFDKQWKYRYPVVEYFLNYYSPEFVINGIKMDLKNIKLIEPNTDKEKLLLNQAFISIKYRFDNGEFK